MLTIDGLELGESAFISLVGAGGKSSLFSILAWELSKKKKRMVLTTTTHMFTCQLNPFLKTGELIESIDEQHMDIMIKQSFYQNRNRTMILINHRITEHGKEKISGPKPHYLDEWWQEKLADYFIIEADGARERAIKAPADHEPPIPKKTTDLIGVIGIDALGLPLVEENVFRAHLFCRLTGLNMGEPINMHSMISLVNHPEGLFKNTPSASKCHFFINKVNSRVRKELADQLAFQLLQNDRGKINDIIIGDTFQMEKPIYKILKGKRE